MDEKDKKIQQLEATIQKLLAKIEELEKRLAFLKFSYFIVQALFCRLNMKYAINFIVSEEI